MKNILNSKKIAWISLMILPLFYLNCSKNFESTSMESIVAKVPTTAEEPPAIEPTRPESDPSNPDWLPLGTIEEKSSTCLNPSNLLPNTTCKTLTVNCPGLNPIDVNLKITQPSNGTNTIGTVVLGTGGNGTGFIDSNNPMRDVITQLSNEGYLVVQRAWATTWTKSDVGMAKAACRYATLLKHANTNYHSQGGGAFCAGGNSAGGSEISYALARYGLGSILNFAIVSGGPPMGRLDLGCLGSSDWTDKCSSVVPPENFVFSQSLDCNVGQANFSLIDGAYGNSKACSLKNESYRTLLYEDSLASTKSVFSFPDTKIHFIYGQQDFTFATPSGHTFSLEVTSQKEFTYISGVAHGVVESAAGAQAYHDSIISNCKK